MSLDRRFAGREEKRLPVIMEAKLASAESASAERQEIAHIENLSVLGARVYASGPWQLGEQVAITPVTGGQPLRGEVIYCQKQADGRFVIGLKFQRNPLLWSMLQKLEQMVR